MWKCPCLGERAAAWEQKERSAFGENAVERPLVPLQNRGVSREERFSTEVTTDGSWERSVTDCVSVALTKEGANGAQGAALVGGDSPAVEAEWSCAPVSTAREREKHLTPSVRCLSDGTRVGRKVDKTQRRQGTKSIGAGVHTDLLPLNFGLPKTEIPRFALHPDICRCRAGSPWPQRKVSPWLGTDTASCSDWGSCLLLVLCRELSSSKMESIGAKLWDAGFGPEWELTSGLR